MWNPFDPALRADPYPTYRELLDEAAIPRGPLGLPLLARYDDCLAVLRHPLASKDWRKSPAWTALAGQGESPVEPSFLELDPPDHTRLRGLVSRAFTPARIERLRPRIAELAERLVADIAGGTEVEIVSHLALPLPLAIICELIGVPSADAGEIRTWSGLLARTVDPIFSIPPEILSAALEARSRAFAYLADLVAQRRAAPRDDLVSELLAARDHGDQLSEGEVLATLVLLLAAGHETTVNLIANGVLAFARHPGEFERLRADPALARGAVEEVLRFDPPVHLDARLLLEDIDLPSGAHLAVFELPLLLLGAANRDPSRFEGPEAFDIGRSDNRHLGFGFGIHHCLGAPLARAEGELVFAALARRFRTIEVEHDPPAYKDNVTLRGVASLPAVLLDA